MARSKAADTQGDWQSALRQHAWSRFETVRNCLSQGQPIPPRDPAILSGPVSVLGEEADDAVRMVDRLAMGAAAEAYSAGDDGAPDAAFDEELGRLLAGFSPKSVEKGADSPAPKPRLFQRELWQVLHKIRESAELSYAREIELVELDRRILFLLRSQGPLVPADLSSSVGVDKAQISRSVKRLLELKMVERDQIRSPVALTRKGEAISDKLLRRADLRNRELSFDVSDGELSAFLTVIETLLERAKQLYEQERDHARQAGNMERPPLLEFGYEPRDSGDAVVIDRSRIVSPLLTLSAYFQRSGALAMKRLTGLSNFESWVLSEISLDPPTEWSGLVKTLERDHSQAGRTVNNLIEKGLVVREGKPGRRHGRFSPSEEGERLFALINKAGMERGAYLMKPISSDRLEIFFKTFDKIRRNAAAQLERERAFEELEDAS